VLKKAGIVVAATAAGLLSISPLAFANDGDKRHYDDVNKNINKVENNGRHVNVQVCKIEVVPKGTVPTNDLLGALALLGRPAPAPAPAEYNDCDPRTQIGDVAKNKAKQKIDD
jgi:hypothetical protein